jgi:phosphopantothenoylcysteine synthetase/decarboxylase
MHILVTAGNTLVPIDRVRCITNIFTGRTGARIALHGCERGHTVRLLTSHPDAVSDLPGSSGSPRLTIQTYQTFNDLRQEMEGALRQRPWHALVHCAAVSDYQTAGVYAPVADTHFDPDKKTWQSTSAREAALSDRSAGKVKSDEPELWLRLVRTPKLIDLVRKEWAFRGILVKFKLEVGIDDARLLNIAERSRQSSEADLMVANTLEGAQDFAFMGPIDGSYQRVSRSSLPARLLEAVERLSEERGHG